MLHAIVVLQTMLTSRLDRDDRGDRGATAVEYGLMVSLIAVAIVVTVGALGIQLDETFQTVLTAITPE